MTRPLRIGLVADTWFPAANGVVSVVSTLRDGLQEQGQTVRVLAVAPSGLLADRQPDARFSGLPVFSAVDARATIGMTDRLRRCVLEHNLDLLHTHTEFGLAWAAVRVARQLGIPHVHTLHTPWDQYRHYLRWLPFSPARWSSLLRGTLSRFLSYPTVLTVPGRKAQQWLVGHGLRSSDQIIPNPVHTRFLYPDTEASQRLRAQLGLGPDDKMLLVVGRLAPEKRTDELLTALAPLLSADPGLWVFLLGKGRVGPQRIKLSSEGFKDGLAGRSDTVVTAALPNLQMSAEVGGRVISVGRISWEQLPIWYGAAQGLVSGSLSEFQPVSVLEALTIGIPVVARADPAYHEIALSFGDGVIFLVGSDFELAVGVQKVLAAPPPPFFIQSTSRFSSDAVARDWLGLYRSLASGASFSSHTPSILPAQVPKLLR